MNRLFAERHSPFQFRQAVLHGQADLGSFHGPKAKLRAEARVPASESHMRTSVTPVPFAWGNDIQAGLRDDRTSCASPLRATTNGPIPFLSNLLVPLHVQYVYARDKEFQGGYDNRSIGDCGRADRHRRASPS